MFSPNIACRETAALAAASQVDLCLSARPAPRPNKAQSSDVCIDLTVDPPRAKDRTLRRQSVDNGRVASTWRAAFGTVDQEQLQIDSKKRKHKSFDVLGDHDLVRGSKRPATPDERQAFANNFHQAPHKRPRKKSVSPLSPPFASFLPLSHFLLSFPSSRPCASFVPISFPVLSVLPISPFLFVLSSFICSHFHLFSSLARPLCLRFPSVTCCLGATDAQTQKCIPSC